MENTPNGTMIYIVHLKKHLPTIPMCGDRLYHEWYGMACPSFPLRDEANMKKENGAWRIIPGLIIPYGWRLLDPAIYGDYALCACPVRDCRKRLNSLMALAGHMNASHYGKAFNDNQDGTISLVSPYNSVKSVSSHTCPVIISRLIPASDWAPAVEPTLTAANETRLRKMQDSLRTTASPKPALKPLLKPNQTPGLQSPGLQSATPDVAPTPVAPTPNAINGVPAAQNGAGLRKLAPAVPLAVHNPNLPPNLAPSSDPSDPIQYLNGFLAHRQRDIIRDDVRSMSTMPRLRELPNAWLEHHQSEVLDSDLYACALAYIVGESVTGVSRCRRSENQPDSETYRLSNLCVRLPPSMAFSNKQIFSSTRTCVGCKYWACLYRQPNPCEWNPDNAAKIKSVEEANDEIFNDASSAAASEETELDEVLSPRQTRRMRRARERVVVSSDSVEPESRISRPPPKLQKLDKKDDVEEQEDDVMESMENWEFAPGKVLDKKHKESEWDDRLRLLFFTFSFSLDFTSSF